MTIAARLLQDSEFVSPKLRHHLMAVSVDSWGIHSHMVAREVALVEQLEC
jgi:hypothetical protein